jgi:hypothetical protein
VTLDAMAQIGPTARGVAVVDTSVADADLKRMNDLGIRGIRFNLVQAGATTVEMIEPLSKRINDLGWHIQIHMKGEQIAGIEDLLLRVPSPIVFDHFGRLAQPNALDSPGFKTISKLIDKGRPVAFRFVRSPFRLAPSNERRLQPLGGKSKFCMPAPIARSTRPLRSFWTSAPRRSWSTPMRCISAVGCKSLR